jgi:hypothetical protein
MVATDDTRTVTRFFNANAYSSGQQAVVRDVSEKEQRGWSVRSVVELPGMQLIVVIYEVPV